MRKSTLKTITLLLCSLLTVLFSFAQNGKGVLYTGQKGVTKTVGQLLAEDAAHPKLPYQMRYKREHDAHLHWMQNPDAINASQYVPNSPLRAATTPPLMTPTQSIWSNFLAVRIGDTPGWNPPDDNGDVGTTQLCTTVNGRVRFYNKPSPVGAQVTTPTGTSNTEPGGLIFDIDSDVFFTDNTIGVTTGSDLHVRFDRLSQRWFIVQIDISHNKNNYCQIAVSSGPTVSNLASFTFYSFKQTQVGGATANFFDYPTLGIDANSLYIGSNIFAPGFKGCSMYVVKKSDLIAGTLTVTGFNYNTYGTVIYTPQGVHNDDASATEGYFIGASQTVGGKLIIKRVTYPGGVPTMSADINITTIATTAPFGPPNKGGGTLDALDLRPFAAMIHKNKISGVSSLWTANTSRVTSAGVASGTGDRDATVWYEIGSMTTTPVLLRSVNFYDGSATTPINYINGSIAMSGQGHNVISMTSSGTNNYAQLTIAGRYRTDAATIFQAPVDATTTTSSYTGSRWGDYSQTVVDPADDMTMWTFGQYSQGTNNWGTRAVQLKAPPPPAVFTLTPAPSCGTNTITMNGTSVNNSEFFDPGPGYLNRLQVAVTGPSAVTVTNVTFVSPTQITADFNLPVGTLAGTYTVTVTNPDGQTTITTFVLGAPCTPLPVTLLNFTGNLVAKTVDLNWNTTSEINFKNFVVEKSLDGNTFENLTQVTARGGLNTSASYSTVDNYPYPGYSYYRLRIINTDGSYSYSNVVRIKTIRNSVSLTRLYPNPTSSLINYEIVSDNSQSISVEIFDLAGRKMSAQSILLSPGMNQKQITISNFAAGTYILQFKDMQGNIIEKAKVIKN